MDDYGHFSQGAQKTVGEFVAAMDGAYTPLPARPSAGPFTALHNQR